MSHNENEFADRKGHQILHVRDDSDTLLNSLFDLVLKKQNDGCMPAQVPLSMRKLPKSFFHPPAHGSKSPSISHSRNSSTDSSSGGPLQPHTGAAVAPMSHHHLRAHSSPASLQQTYAVCDLSQQQQHAPYHAKQHSYDVADDMPLPPGWEQSVTSRGQTYYIDHSTQTTTWEDPRKKIHLYQNNSMATNNSQPNGAQPNSIAPSQVLSSPQQLQQQLQQLSVGNSFDNQTHHLPSGPLPQGWTQAETEDGEVYYIDHVNRNTSWFDPRLPEHVQRAALMKRLSHMQQQEQQNVRLQKLQAEREKLRVRQRQMMKQIECDDPNSGSNTATSNAVLSDSHHYFPNSSLANQRLTPASTAQQVSANKSLELFLDQHNSHQPQHPPHQQLDLHSRQESTDSGVGLNVNYTLPNTPNDMLSPMEDLESRDVLGTLNETAASNLIHNSDAMAMDSEELIIPTIQPFDNDTLMSNDLLGDFPSLVSNNHRNGIDISSNWL